MHVPDLAAEDALPDGEVLLQVLDLEQRAVACAHATLASPEIVPSRSLRLSSTDSQQRSRWSGAASTRFFNSGSSWQRSNACGQRGRNLQPPGRLISEGGAPVIECSFSGF